MDATFNQRAPFTFPLRLSMTPSVTTITAAVLHCSFHEDADDTNAKHLLKYKSDLSLTQLTALTHIRLLFSAEFTSLWNISTPPPLYPQPTLTTHLLTGNICTAAICRHTPNLFPAPCLCRNTHGLTPGSRVTPDTGEQETLVAFVVYGETAVILQQI